MKNFLGNKKAGNHADLVGNMLSAFRHLGCKMSIKVHFLFSHLDKFPDSLGAVSDEQGERFHQDLIEVEERYQGRWDRHMMADYCWSIKRDCPAMVYKRKTGKIIMCTTFSTVLYNADALNNYTVMSQLSIACS